LIERGSRNVPGRVEGLELGWWDVIEALVQAVVVDPADVLHDGQREQLEAGELRGDETLDATATVAVRGLSRDLVVTGTIALS
jgi:hypothetical protein